MSVKQILFAGFLGALVIVGAQWIIWGFLLADAMAASHANLPDAIG